MCLLEFLEWQVLLGEPKPREIHDQLAGHVEFDASSECFFVPLENHVHQHLELCCPILAAEFSILLSLEEVEWVVLGVTTLERNLSLVQAASMYQRVKTLEIDGPLRQWFALAQEVLSGNFDLTTVEMG